MNYKLIDKKYNHVLCIGFGLSTQNQPKDETSFFHLPCSNVRQINLKDLSLSNHCNLSIMCTENKAEQCLDNFLCECEICRKSGGGGGGPGVPGVPGCTALCTGVALSGGGRQLGHSKYDRRTV